MAAGQINNLALLIDIKFFKRFLAILYVIEEWHASIRSCYIIDYITKMLGW